jgi:DNA-binding transcriptional LysR family regulator
MDRFHLLNVFVAVAEEEGFAAAARRLNLSPPAVTRAVAALEGRLGVRLLDRTTRYVRVTEAGQRYLHDARRILAELESADESAAGITSEPRGELAVTAPVLFGRLHVMPGIIEYLNRYPDTSVNALFVDRVVNLVEEGIDVGIRIGRLPDSSLRARRVGDLRLVCCAAPEYVSSHGEPRTPEDLAQHTVIESRAGSGSQGWRFELAGGLRTLRLRPRITVTTNDAAVEAAVSGIGITRLLSYQVAAEVEAGRLVTLLDRYEPEMRPVSVIHREGRYTSAKLRAFVDLLAEHLGKVLGSGLTRHPG